MSGEIYGMEGDDERRAYHLRQVHDSLREAYRTHAQTDVVPTYDSLGQAIGILAGTTPAFGSEGDDCGTAWSLIIRKVDPLVLEGEYSVAVENIDPVTGMELRRTFHYNTTVTRPSPFNSEDDDRTAHYMLARATYSEYASEEEVRTATGGYTMHPVDIISSGAVYQTALGEAQRAVAERAHRTAAVAREQRMRHAHPLVYAVYRGLRWLKERKAR